VMGPLDSIPVFIQAVVVAMVFAGLTVGGLYLVRRRIAPDFLREDHDVAGVTFSVVGAFYGVVLAFVIVAVWQRFERADDRAQAEGLAVSNLYFLSQGFDQPVSGAIQNSLRKYASTVVSREWEQMADNRYSSSIDNESELWRLLRSYHPRTPEQQTFLDKSIDQMVALSDARRLRYVYYKEDLPSVIWIVIYVGCAITLSFSYFFGTQHFRAQVIMCGTFAALIGLTILAISELATPYQGAIVVSNEPFRFVLAAMASDQKAAAAAHGQPSSEARVP
jgi:hypothetical protein